MIHDIIGSGVLIAIGGVLVWTVMAWRQAKRDALEVDIDAWLEASALPLLQSERAAHDRCADALEVVRDRADDVRDYCEGKARVRTSVITALLNGDA